MVVSLEGEKLVNSSHRYRVPAPQPEQRTAWKCVRRVPDQRAASSHRTRSRNFLSMHKPGEREVAATERAGDPMHVGSNLGYTSGIARVALEHNAATVRQRLELVNRSVLIDAHGDMPAGLDLGESAVGRCVADAAMPVLSCSVRAAAQNGRQNEQQR